MTEPAVAIIPARLGSTRFPRKVLASATGKPLIQHVCEAAATCPGIGRIVVATDAEEVAAAVRGFGGEAVMTAESHPNGTSRINEAAETLALAPSRLVVNLQGDEPEIAPDAVARSIEALLRTPDPAPAMIGTAAAPFGPGENVGDPNAVKVVINRAGDALYFSRAPIPHVRDPGEPIDPGARPLRHIGIYVYRRSFLARYAAMAPSPLEQAEKLEQLRALENGCRIAVGLTGSRHAGIDTPEQYEAFVRRWRERDP